MLAAPACPSEVWGSLVCDFGTATEPGFCYCLSLSPAPTDRRCRDHSTWSPWIGWFVPAVAAYQSSHAARIVTLQRCPLRKGKRFPTPTFSPGRHILISNRQLPKAAKDSKSSYPFKNIAQHSNLSTPLPPYALIDNTSCIDI